MTLDESIFAGFNSYSSNSSNYNDQTNYLYSGNHYWTISPVTFYTSKDARVGFINYNGGTGAATVNSSGYGVRPGISLTSSATLETNGDGSKDNPYKIKVNSRNTYAISYDSNGGSGEMETTICTKGKECIISDNTFVRTGYTFAGWTKDTTSGTIYKSGDKVTDLADNGTVEMHAKWKVNTFTVTYNANGGTGTMSKLTCRYNSNCFLASNSFKKDGYKFVAWAKDSVNGTRYAPGTNFKNLLTSGNINVYAIWQEMTAFEKDSWATIAANVKKGNTSQYNVGDTREIYLTSDKYTSYTLRLANKSACTNGETSETACGFVIEFEKSIIYSQYNTTDTNVGGWRDSALRSNIVSKVYEKFPDDLKSVVASTKVVSGHGSTKGETNFITNDYVYLLSVKEIFGEVIVTSGTIRDSLDVETRQLDYYKNLGVTISNKSGAIKKFGGSKDNYWTRSVSLTDKSSFQSVSSAGGPGIPIASMRAGVSPAFRIA